MREHRAPPLRILYVFAADAFDEVRHAFPGLIQAGR